MSSSTALAPDRPTFSATIPAPRSTGPEPSGRREFRSQRTAELLDSAADCTDDERGDLLDAVVRLNMPVAEALASRYRRRGINDDDLQQVAYLALVKASRRYDPHAGHDFLAFCVPTIRGELKRHFRDQGWTVRPPRRIQEIQGRMVAAQSELEQRLGRSPRPTELAEELDAPIEDVTEALAVKGCFTPTSLDLPVGDNQNLSLGELIGEAADGQAAAEARVVLAPALATLGDRDRRILLLRFVEGWTQQEIADEIGVTQMQVSRLLTRILRDLKRVVTGER